MTDEAGNSSYDDYESSTEYCNWYGYPPYPYYPYSSTSMTTPIWTAQGPGATTSTRKDVPNDVSEGESSDAESVSTDVPPSPKKITSYL